MLMQRLLLSDRGGMVVLGIIAVATLLIPILNMALPPDSPFYVSNYMVALLGKFLCFALLALSVDLIWGYAGILSLGHGAFFALGGYAMGMHLMRQIGDRGVYGHPELMDFMVVMNWEALPWYWQGFDMFWFAMLMVLLVPGLLALVFGFLAFRARVTGVYFAIITQALTYALMLAFFRNEMGFGGNNGLNDFKEILGFTISAKGTRVGLFVTSALVLIVAYMACRYIITSRMGRVILSIRDAESRTRFSGYKVESYKLWLFVFSSMLAAIAGALYVPQVGIINPGEFSPLNSIEMVIWVAAGGRGTLFGAIVGAFSVNYAKTFFTSWSPEAWLFILGSLFVLVTLLLPKGLVGLFDRFRRKLKHELPEQDEPVDDKAKINSGGSQ